MGPIPLTPSRATGCSRGTSRERSYRGRRRSRLPYATGVGHRRGAAPVFDGWRRGIRRAPPSSPPDRTSCPDPSVRRHEGALPTPAFRNFPLLGNGRRRQYLCPTRLLGEGWTMPDAANLRRRRLPLTGLIAATAVARSAVALFAACGGDPDLGHAGPQPDAQPHPTAGPVDQQPDTLNDLQSRAREVLATRLSVTAESLTLISDEIVQWSDASLGCPQEGMGWAQVITPGRRMTFRHNENTYEVHMGTADSGQEPVSREGGISY